MLCVCVLYRGVSRCVCMCVCMCVCALCVNEYALAGAVSSPWAECRRSAEVCGFVCVWGGGGVVGVGVGVDRMWVMI